MKGETEEGGGDEMKSREEKKTNKLNKKGTERENENMKEFKII